jgi:hypothetical protein
MVLIFVQNLFSQTFLSARASAGEGKGGNLPPWPAKIACFSTFIKETSMFLGINSMFLPPWKILPSPGKKSADADISQLSIDFAIFKDP